MPHTSDPSLAALRLRHGTPITCPRFRALRVGEVLRVPYPASHLAEDPAGAFVYAEDTGITLAPNAIRWRVMTDAELTAAPLDRPAVVRDPAGPWVHLIDTV